MGSRRSRYCPLKCSTENSCFYTNAFRTSNFNLQHVLYLINISDATVERDYRNCAVVRSQHF